MDGEVLSAWLARPLSASGRAAKGRLRFRTLAIRLRESLTIWPRRRVDGPGNLPAAFHGAALPFSVPLNRESKESLRCACWCDAL